MILNNISKIELRKFALTFSLVVVTIFGLLLPWYTGRTFPMWPWIVGGIFFFFGIIWPIGLKPFYYVWMKFGHVMGWINSRIILSLVFYFIISPMGLIMRLAGNDLLSKKFKPTQDSYRIERNEVIKAEDMEKPY